MDDRLIAESLTKRVAKRFRLPGAPSLVSSIAGMSPITFTWLRCDTLFHGSTDSAPTEDAYVAQIVMDDLRDSALRLHRKPVPIPNVVPKSGFFLFNIETDPVAEFRNTFNLVRFYISQVALEELARSSGERPPGGLKRPPFGEPDVVLYQLAQALIPAFNRQDEVNSLFVDQVAMAFHAHLVQKYAGPCLDIRMMRNGLASWQARRAAEAIEARLDGVVTIAELAQECCLSPKHFAKSFRQTFGVAPYQWLQERRIDRAKQLLRMKDMSLATIATACGFSSHSHFNRVFTGAVGMAPGAWRRFMGHRPPLCKRFDA